MENKRKFEVDYTPNEINILLKRMNTYPYNSKEYKLIRNSIFKIYYKYPEHIINRFINKLDIPYEDLLNDIYVFLLEAIENYEFDTYFTMHINKYISYKIYEKYKIQGIGINKYKKYLNNDDVTLEYILEKHPSDINDIIIKDGYSYIDMLLDNIEKEELREIILNLILDLDKLPTIKNRLPKNITNYKRLLIVRYGLVSGKKISVKETAKIFGRKEKWVQDNLTIARKYLKDAFILYNSKVSTYEKIYLK